MSKLLPVIHVDAIEQAVRNAVLSKNAGANGCFLIQHGSDRQLLLEAYEAVKAEVGDWWIGINDLGRNGLSLLEGLPAVNGLWVDNINHNKELMDHCIDVFRDGIDVPYRKTLIFGGTAFKYQKKVDDVAQAAFDAIKYCDVVTTSGDGTGQPPTIEKVRLMKDAIDGEFLAVASGITAENIEPFIQYVDYFLIATGISSSFYELDPVKVEEIVTIISK